MNGIRRDELDREICGFQARGGNTAVMNAWQTYTAKHMYVEEDIPLGLIVLRFSKKEVDKWR